MKQFYQYYFSAWVVFSIAFSSAALSQEPPIIWGEIPRADLEMKSYPKDTNASAVILCDYGNSSFDFRINTIVYERHMRIKIITNNGYKLATHSFTLNTSTGGFITSLKKMESIRKIEGVTYWLDDHGETLKKELAEEDIQIKEKGGGDVEYWYTMPALRPGCVFEFRYTILSHFPWFRDWIFQGTEPVRWSEYRVFFPGSLLQVAVYQGSEPFAILENSIVPIKSGTERWAKMRWVFQNGKALRSEPFMTNINDYVKRVYIIPSERITTNFDTLQSNKKWKSWIEDLLEDENFGKKIDVTRQAKKLTEQLTTGLTSPREKIIKIYNWIKEYVVCNNICTPYSWQDADDVIESKKGSVADINFLLLSLLKAGGIKGEPIILSTRSNGRFMEFYPVRYQFNYILTRAIIDSQYYYLDATDPSRPFNLLPKELLNMKGLVIKEDTLEWVKLSSSKRYSNISAANITLQKNGSITGTLEDMYRDYAGFEMRNNLKEKKDLEIAKELFDVENHEITIDSLNVEAKDSINLPLKIKARISSSSYAQYNGDLIYFNPHILHRLMENPLKSEKRNFPLDYAYQREHTAVVNLTIPDSLEVQANVVSRNLVVGSNLALFSRKVIVKGNQIRIQYKWEIRETEIDTTYYSQMRDLYAQIIAIESEQFVFARIKQPVAPPSSHIPSGAEFNNESHSPKKKGKK